MTDAQAALAQVRDALAAMRGDWLGDGFTKLRRSQIVAVLDEQAAKEEIERLRNLLDEVRRCFTRDDDLPDDLLPRIDDALKEQR